MTEQELIDKIKALIAERDNFVSNANSAIGAYNGRIAVYQEWLASLSTPPPPPPADKKEGNS